MSKWPLRKLVWHDKLSIRVWALKACVRWKSFRILLPTNVCMFNVVYSFTGEKPEFTRFWISPRPKNLRLIILFNKNFLLLQNSPAGQTDSSAFSFSWPASLALSSWSQQAGLHHSGQCSGSMIHFFTPGSGSGDGKKIRIRDLGYIVTVFSG